MTRFALYVGDEAIAEERGHAAACAVEELIGEDEVERTVFLFERTDGAEREDALNAERLHAVDIGAEVQFRRRNAMAAAVAGEKCDRLTGQYADDVTIRRAAPGSVDVDLLVGFETGHGVEPAAADDSGRHAQYRTYLLDR